MCVLHFVKHCKGNRIDLLLKNIYNPSCLPQIFPICCQKFVINSVSTYAAAQLTGHKELSLLFYLFIHFFFLFLFGSERRQTETNFESIYIN